MPPLSSWLRPWLYVLLGLLVGLLFLAELALSTVIAVDLALLMLSVAGLAGVVRRWRALEMWPLFVAAGLLIPIVVDAQIVGMPRCGAVAAGTACFAGTRDAATPFIVESLAFVIALAAIVALVAREVFALRHRSPR